MALAIRTNNHSRETLSYHDLTDKERAWFDHRTADDGALFARYRGTTYDVSEFMRVPSNSDDLAGWDGYHGESYFSGALVKFVDNGESIIMGRYYDKSDT